MKYYAITNEEDNNKIQSNDNSNISEKHEHIMIKLDSYITDIKNIHKYLHKGNYVREIILLKNPNSRTTQVSNYKWMANRFNLGQRYKLSDVNTFKILADRGMRIHVDDICLKWARKFKHVNILNFLMFKGEKYDQWFYGINAFGRQRCCEISRYGYSINNAYLMITLPQLPDGIRYKSAMIYQLIKNITIQIGEENIISYDSLILECIDKLYGINSDPIIDDVVCYQIPIKYIFQDIKFTKNDYNHFNYIFNGILLGDLNYCRVLINVKLGNILDVVDNRSVMEIILKGNDRPPMEFFLEEKDCPDFLFIENMFISCDFLIYAKTVMILQI